MYNDLPPLVDSNAWNAGGTPWHSAGNSPPVMPGGFGAGTPHLHHAQQHPTPAQSHRSISRDASRSTSGNNHNPWLQAPSPPSGFGTVHDPFSMPAAAFDQGFGSPPPAGAWGFGTSPPPAGAVRPWGAGVDPPPLGMASPGNTPWYTLRTHQQDPEEGEDDSPPGLEGWGGGGGGGEPWGSPSPNPWGAWGQSGASSPSPSASVINGFASGPRSQYKRPEEWRQDFSMSKPGALTRVFSLGKGSKGSGFSLFNRPTVHWTLDTKGARCSWDIRRPPDAFLVLPEHRPLTFLELQEGAMSPPPLRMKLVHPMLPWTVHIAAGPGEVITVAHLLSTLYAEFSRQVFQRDFWNDELSEEDRKRIHDAWSTRCGGDRAVAEQGIKRVDFLCDRWVFEGIRRVGDAWEMKLKSGRRYM